MPARTAALSALKACRTRGAWSDAVLKDEIEKAGLSRKDAALCTTLCCGVLQNQALLDYYIDLFLTGRKHLQPALRDILRLAVYQITMLDRVPDSAAVNEAVKQAKKQFSQREAGLCNGVLRNMLRQQEKLTPPPDYAVRFSHPTELVDLMKESVGRRLGDILAADNSQPETCIQVNTLKTEDEALLPFEGGRRYCTSIGISAGPFSGTGSGGKAVGGCAWAKARNAGAGSLRSARREIHGSSHVDGKSGRDHFL